MRKPFLDNLRHGIVLAVIVYHVFYLFNSVGVITNVVIPGIPALDAVLYVLHPWFMVTMFAIAGICARYALQNQTDKAYLKSKLRRQLLPSVMVVLLIGWTSGWVTNQYTDMFMGAGDAIPGVVKYLIYCMSGIGVLWFLHQLLAAEVVLVLMRKLDKKDRLHTLGGRVSFPVLCLMALLMWASAQVLNTPLIEVYRNGIYIFAFLAGYCVFSHERVQEMLSKHAPYLLAVSGVLAAAYTVWAWGENYAELSRLKTLLTNVYAWFAMLAVLGAGKRWMNKETAFTRHMAKHSFGYYVLHYPLLALSAYVMDRYLHLPSAAMIPLLLIECAVVLPPAAALVRRIPVLRTLVLGEKW